MKASYRDLRLALEAMLSAFAPNADWTQPDKLHCAVKQAGIALGKITVSTKETK